jgi:hypothetical protein
MIKLNSKIGILFFIGFCFFKLNLHAQEYDVVWNNLVGMTFDQNNNLLTKTSSNGWSNAGALSENKLKKNTDGYISYLIEDVSTKRFIGLSTDNSEPSFNHVDYGFYQKNNRLFIIEDGRVRGFYGRIAVGDVIIVERASNHIHYKKNNAILRRTVTKPNFTLYSDVSIYNPNGTISGLKTSFPIDIKVQFSTTNVTCSTSEYGSVDATITGGLPPYTISWDNGETTEDLTELLPGRYKLTVTDANGFLKTKTASIYADLSWLNAVNVSTNNGVITKSNSSTLWDAGAISENKLVAGMDGRVEYTIDATNKFLAFGLSSDNPDENLPGIDHAIVLLGGKRLFVMENGNIKGFSRYKVGDKVRIIRVGNKIKYKLNNNLIKKSVIDNQVELFVDISIKASGAGFNGLKVDFCYSNELTASPIVVNVIDGILGSIDLNITGGKAPYQVFWETDQYLTEAQFDADKQAKIDVLIAAGLDATIFDALTYPNYTASFSTTNLKDVKPGKYRVFIYDAQGTSIYKEVGISSNFVVDQNVGLDISGLQISKTTGVNSWSDYFTSSSIGGPDDNGWYQFEVDNDVSTFVTGFKDLDVTPNINPYDDIAFGFKVVNNTLSIVEGETEIAMGSVGKDDLLSIEKQGSNIKYFKNGVQIMEASGADNVYQLKGHLFTKTPAFLIKFKPFLLTPTIRDINISHLSCGEENTGAIDVTIFSPPFGGPLTVLWDGLKDPVYTEDLSGLIPGTYTLSATNNFGTTVQEIWVGYETVWTDKQNILSQAAPNENSIYPVSSGVLGSAKSINVLNAGEAGWQQYELDNIGRLFDMGYVEVSFKNDAGDYAKITSPITYHNHVYYGSYSESNGMSVSSQTIPPMSNFSAFRIYRSVSGAIGYTGLSDIYSNSYTNEPGSLTMAGDVYVDVKIYSFNQDGGNENIIELNNPISSFDCPPIVNYTELKTQLDGSYYVPWGNKVKFLYKVRYKQEQNQSLVYNIYNEQRSLVANRAIDGTTTIPLSPNQDIIYGQNICELDVSDLDLLTGTYTLEVISPKKDKMYLKFVID